MTTSQGEARSYDFATERTTPLNQTLLELQDVIVNHHTEATGFLGLWGARAVRAVDGVSLTLSRGETLGLMGGSGAGKTTLAEAVTCRRGIDRGKLLVDGRDITKAKGDERQKLRRRLQMIRQDARESLDMERTIRKQLVALAKENNLPDGEARVARAMDMVELPQDFLDRTPREMSGGQQQRVAIARALAMNPLMVAADEPVSGVDPQLQRDMLGLMERLQKQQNIAYLLISQEPRVISRLAHRLAVMGAGRVYEVGSTEQVFGGARHPYSRLFLGLEKGLLPAEEDTVGKTFAGCPWAAHCPVASDTCRQQRPEMRAVAPGHLVACHAV